MIYDSLYICLECFLGLQILKLVSVYWIGRPDTDIVAGLPTIFGKWFTSVFCLLQGPELMLKAYGKAAGRPFAIPTLTNYWICISDAKQISELRNAPSHQLSFKKFLQETVWPEHTRLSSLETSHQQSNVSAVALKMGLRSSLPALRRELQEKLEKALESEVQGSADSNGWVKMPLSAASYRIAGKLNCFVILGEKLSRAALQYAYDAAITTELMRFTPSILQSTVSFVSMNWSGACAFLQKRVTREIEERLSSQKCSKDADVEQLDCIQWTIDAFRRINEVNVAGTLQRTMGFSFASAHQVPPIVASSLYTLCKYPEYLRPLQEEISRVVEDDAISSSRNQDTPLLDSFIKETARLHPLQIVAMNRKVMTPFVFSDGTHIPAGNVVCVPQQAMMQDPNNYANPLEFQGFRFVTWRDGIPTSTSRLSHPGPLFPFWGSVGHACPARFYVSMTVKMIMVHVIKHYDIKLANEDAKPHFSWGINLVTHPGLTLLIRRKVPA
ncbi:cytochrome P450 [Usnea florida]